MYLYRNEQKSDLKRADFEIKEAVSAAAGVGSATWGGLRQGVGGPPPPLTAPSHPALLLVWLWGVVTSCGCSPWAQSPDGDTRRRPAMASEGPRPHSGLPAPPHPWLPWGWRPAHPPFLVPAPGSQSFRGCAWEVSAGKAKANPPQKTKEGKSRAKMDVSWLETRGAPQPLQTGPPRPSYCMGSGTQSRAPWEL